MNHPAEYLEEIKQMYQDLYHDEAKREASIQQSASRLLIGEGVVLGMMLIASILIALQQKITIFDMCADIFCAGTIFAAMLIAVLAQWHPGRDRIANVDDIQVQLEEAPESFRSHEQRVQYELDLYQKVASSLQHSSFTLNNRLRSSGITFLAGSGLWILAIGLCLFGI